MKILVKLTSKKFLRPLAIKNSLHFIFPAPYLNFLSSKKRWWCSSPQLVAISLLSVFLGSGLSGCGWTRTAYDARQTQQEQIGQNRHDWQKSSQKSSQNGWQKNTANKPASSKNDSYNLALQDSQQSGLLKEIAQLKEENKRLRAQKSSKTPSATFTIEPPLNPRKLKPIAQAKASYQNAYLVFSQQQYKQAVVAFKAFLSQYPNDIHSDNAQFWIGESYFRLGKQSLALNAYQKVLREYQHRPSQQGYKTPEAMYRIGEIAFQQKEPQKALQYLKSLQQRFPESTTASKATKLLRRHS